jgi:hypothetical protein
VVGGLDPTPIPRGRFLKKSEVNFRKLRTFSVHEKSGLLLMLILVACRRMTPSADYKYHAQPPIFS